jgi:transposase
MVGGIVYRYRTGIAWRDLPEVFGPWQTVWTWHHRMAKDGTWDRVLAKLTAAADAGGLGRLVAVSGLNDRPRAPARDEHHPPHRGLDRITRIRNSSRLIMASAGPEAACRRRSTSSSTATGFRW